MTVNVDPAWHETYFAKDWLPVARGFADVDTGHEIEFITRVLALEPGMHVVDVPCGHGRHSLELARRGVSVTGIDSSAESVAAAVADARRSGLEGLARFEVADMRTATVDRPSDAVMIMQTSFGFMATEAEDQQILENVREMLASGGRLLLDVVNLFRLVRTMVVPRRWERLTDGTLHIEEREYDFRTGRRNVRVELFTPDGGHREMSHSVRIYALHELDAMLRAAGYRVLEVFGGYDGRPFGFETKRLIVVAEKPR